MVSLYLYYAVSQAPSSNLPRKTDFDSLPSLFLDSQLNRKRLTCSNTFTLSAGPATSVVGIALKNPANASSPKLSSPFSIFSGVE